MTLGKFYMTLCLAMAIIFLVFYPSPNENIIHESMEKACEEKGLELKTSSYDVKKKKFIILCEER